MAKLSTKLKICKQNKLVLRNIIKRKNLIKSLIEATTFNEKLIYLQKLETLSRKSVRTRYKNICWLTNRTRGYYGIVGLSKTKFREYISKGFLPGLQKFKSL